MKRYQWGAGGSTNARIVANIKVELSQGHVPLIFAWEPPCTFVVEGLSVDLVRGLEGSLIWKFKPEWNIHD